MSAPKPAEDDAEAVASLNARTRLLNRAPGRPSDDTPAATAWVIAQPAHTAPYKADAT